MALHQLQNAALLDHCLDALSADDTLLVLDGGCSVIEQISAPPCPVLILEEASATVASKNLSIDLQVISYDQWVSLVTQHAVQVVWK
ncbi:hypothetical protein NOR51B_1302 [Luminiphilus syltensis NOR5-1B]|uniref:Uncharacterized protein n=1 Tax=Luminiphilus syltensis NOR5-1B TaxID=565045 RepID=B8KQS9_9GAMM|nr:hypothetical protein [Luminiphilus syltensis]EED35357.1 hypothetical protein NOR51B_1302 [Luminiphilus syltensis NOR5-1B]